MRAGSGVEVYLKQVQPIEVACPESIILHNDRHNASLQLSHEGSICNQLLHSRLITVQVKVGAPGLIVSCVCRLIAVGGTVTLHAADVCFQTAVFAFDHRA